MKTNEIREKYLDFFKKRNHSILESAPLVVKDTQTVTGITLFNTAGVQSLVPFLLGRKHPQGKRLVSSQKCLRTIDIADVGDNTHLTFFEMLGNWSLGDYFKKEAINWSFEFLTSKTEGLGLNPERIYVTVFEGDENAPKDQEAYNIWKEIIPENRIYFMSKESNWWEAGDNGPCGPDTEIFYDTKGDLGVLNKNEFIDADIKQNVVEIWNNVFMQFEKKDGVIIGDLPNYAVDTGAGLERLSIVVNEKDNIYQSDNFSEIINFISENSDNYIEESARIITDHIKSSIFIISEDVKPSNSEHGYILRRLLRKSIIISDKIAFEKLEEIVNFVAEQYKDIYSQLNNVDEIKKVINEEKEKFRLTLKKGMKEFEKISTQNISGEDAFILSSTYGFPIELIKDMASDKKVEVDTKDFEKRMIEHKNKSRTAAAGKFKGGMDGNGEMETRYHTATHLLHQALRDVLGGHVQQKGSNINSERLRFDFSHDRKMTDKEKQKVEEIVNSKISANLPVNMVELNKKEALETGALHFFGEKYPERVSVYYIGDKIENSYSKEFCGGPHINNTSELGEFKIKKEEASSSGVRRIKAMLK